MSRICRQVQAHLPAHADGSLPGWRRRLVDRHLRRCEDCRAVAARQSEVAAGLDALEEARAAAVDPPPDQLLAAILAQAEQPTLRARAAAPARGAVSGARPVLSVVGLLLAGLVGTAVGYAVWRGLRRLSRARRR